jgi:hypothetical protein
MQEVTKRNTDDDFIGWQSEDFKMYYQHSCYELTLHRGN